MEFQWGQYPRRRASRVEANVEAAQFYHCRVRMKIWWFILMFLSRLRICFDAKMQSALVIKNILFSDVKASPTEHWVSGTKLCHMSRHI